MLPFFSFLVMCLIFLRSAAANDPVIKAVLSLSVVAKAACARINTLVGATEPTDRRRLHQLIDCLAVIPSAVAERSTARLGHHVLLSSLC